MTMRSGLCFGKVINTHPEAHAVDVLLLETGEQLPLVQVLCFGGTDFGGSGLPQPTNPGEYDPQQTKNRDIYAVVGYVRNTPVVLGFLFPQVAQLLFKDINRSIQREPSDVYWTTDGAGNHEFYHPSGTFIRIGTTNDHEDLTGKDLDQLWKITKNTDAAVYAHITVANGGNVVGSAEIDPAGNLTATLTGTATIQAQGEVTVSSDVSVTIDAPVTNVTGNLDVDGNVSAGDGVTGSFSTPTGQTVFVQNGIITNIF